MHLAKKAKSAVLLIVAVVSKMEITHITRTVGLKLEFGQ
jgi:hypothetical protein